MNHNAISKVITEKRDLGITQFAWGFVPLFLCCWLQIANFIDVPWVLTYSAWLVNMPLTRISLIRMHTPDFSLCTCMFVFKWHLESTWIVIYFECFCFFFLDFVKVKLVVRKDVGPKVENWRKTWKKLLSKWTLGWYDKIHIAWFLGSYPPLIVHFSKWLCISFWFSRLMFTSIF